MEAAAALIPFRFGFMLTQLVLTVMLLGSRTAQVESCLSAGYIQGDYDAANGQLIAALVFTVVLQGIEVALALLGYTVLDGFITVLSTVAHAIGSVSTLVFMTSPTSCYTQWYILAFTSLPISVSECRLLLVMVRKAGRD